MQNEIRSSIFDRLSGRDSQLIKVWNILLVLSLHTPHRLTGALYWFDPAGACQLRHWHVDQPHVEAGHVPPPGGGDAADELTAGIVPGVGLDDGVAQRLGVCPEVVRGVTRSRTVGITDTF